MKKNKDFDLFENFVDSEGDFDKVKRNIVTDEPSRAQSLNKRKLALVTTFASVLVVAIILSVIFIPFGFKPDQTANTSANNGVIQKGGWLSYKEDSPHVKHYYENGVCTYCGKPEELDEQGFRYEPYDYEDIGNDEILIKSYKVAKAPEDLDVVNIPSTFNGVPVACIDRVAFIDHKMSAVVIPDTVTYIDDLAFRSCENLKSVVIPDSVTKIGSSVFQDCLTLKSVKLGSGISGISECTFLRCESLTEIDIPETVTAIGAWAFENSACREKDKNLYYVGKWLVESDAENLTDVEIREGTIGIAARTFGNCEKITEAIIPDSVTFLGDHLFYKCTALKSVDFGKGAIRIGALTFQRSEALEEVTFGESVKSVGMYAFSDCENLLKVNYDGDPNSFIKTDFFNPSSNPLCNGAKLYSNKTDDTGEYKLVTKLVIPATTTELKEEIFKHFNDLEAVYYEGSLADWCKINFGMERYFNYPYDSIHFYSIAVNTNPLCRTERFYTKENGVYKLVEDVVIGGDVTEINAYAFNYYKGLKSVTITAPVEKIGNFAFADCENLASVTLPDSVENIGKGVFYFCYALESIDSLLRVKSIGDFAFFDCMNLSGDIILDDIEKIGQGAFVNCNKIDNVILGENLTVTSYQTFANCRGMSGITFKGKVTNIAERLFSGCDKSLTSITIPDSVKDIGNGAFNCCEALLTVTIPDSVEKIGSYAFGDCWNLKRVIIGGGVSDIAEDCFDCKYGTSALESIYYHGTEEEWNAIKINETNDVLFDTPVYETNDVLFNTPVYFYSETEPTEEGNFWHYVDGEAKAW